MMQIIRLKTGKEYFVNWCGVSSLDGILRAEIFDSTFCDVAQDFCNKEAVREIEYIANENTVATFFDYTEITGITSSFSGIVVALKKDTA